jgi:hypothetical protein
MLLCVSVAKVPCAKKGQIVVLIKSTVFLLIWKRDRDRSVYKRPHQNAQRRSFLKGISLTIIFLKLMTSHGTLQNQ